jgi:hypothetical protein
VFTDIEHFITINLDIFETFYGLWLEPLKVVIIIGLYLIDSFGIGFLISYKSLLSLINFFKKQLDNPSLQFNHLICTVP